MATGDSIPDRGYVAAARPLILGLLLGTGACKAEDTAVLPKVDFQEFESRVYPVLMRDCAFPACHGNSERLFQVYGPYRARLPDPENDDELPAIHEAVTPHELAVSFAKSRSMLLHRGELEMAPLLRKPVQGGAHFGTDLWGRNVYRSKKAAGYIKLKSWAEGASDKGDSKE